MAVHIRLQRQGRLHLPYYRIVVTDSRSARNGETIEVIGSYNPLKPDNNLDINVERVHHWVLLGAAVSEGLTSLMKRQKLAPAPAIVAERALKTKAHRKARWAGRKNKVDGKVWVAPSPRALAKHKATVKAAKKAEAAAAAAAAKPADAPVESA